LKQVNVKDILSRVKVLMENQMKEKGIALTVSDTDAVLSLDPDLIEHVLINLLLNAVEAVSDRKDPAIDITASFNDNGNVVIRVTDNGEGMDEETSEKIFIPFFTTRKNGSGIGLAITKQILQLHHADIHFTTARGKGTAFFIVL
jgi:signal transduction histidine kinase